MEPITQDDLQRSDSEDSESEAAFHSKIDDTTRGRIEAERERAQQDLEEALASGDPARLRAAVTRGRRFRLDGLEAAAKVLRKTDKKASKQHKAERRRGDGPPTPAAAAPADREDAKPNKKKHFYVEKQHKGMCRMHALNAFFQRPKLTEEGFAHMCREFEKATGAPRGLSEYFYVEAGGANILSFVVERDRRYRTVYYPPGTQADVDGLNEEEIVGYFEFDSGHVRRPPPTGSPSY